MLTYTIRRSTPQGNHVRRFCTRSSYDYIIVGAGSAGCLLASKLANHDSHRKVLLIEAGGQDNYPWIHLPIGYLFCINNPRTDWQFKTTQQHNLHGRSLMYPRGRVLGGSSSINGMIYMRGQDQDYDHWAEITGTLFCFLTSMLFLSV